MTTSETNSNKNEPQGPSESGPDLNSSETVQAPETEPRSDESPERSAALREVEQLVPATSRSRWVDYDTHELLTMISELEDERRWARLREGVWIAILLHMVLISALTWIPKYVLKEPLVVDPFDAINKRKDLTYLDVPPDLLHKLQPKVVTKPVPESDKAIDKKTLEEMKKVTPPTPQPTPQTTTPAPVQQEQPAPTVAQSPVEAPHPAAVPARPNFAMNSPSQADQLREAMKGGSHSYGQGSGSGGSGGLARHPGAGSGGVEVLSDTQGVDFSGWLQRWHYETERTWDPLIPDEVNPPILKKGQVMIRFKVQPNGRIIDGSMVLEGRSGDVALDRAAWGALQGSNYPPLPKEFHGPYLELRALFMYNMQAQ